MNVILHESGMRIDLNSSHLIKMLEFNGKSEGDGRLTDAPREQKKSDAQVQTLECTNQYRLRHTLPLRIVAGMGNCRMCLHDGLNERCPGYWASQIADSAAQISYAELM